MGSVVREHEGVFVMRRTKVVRVTPSGLIVTERSDSAGDGERRWRQDGFTCEKGGYSWLTEATP